MTDEEIHQLREKHTALALLGLVESGFRIINPDGRDITDAIRDGATKKLKEME